MEDKQPEFREVCPLRNLSFDTTIGLTLTASELPLQQQLMLKLEIETFPNKARSLLCSETKVICKVCVTEGGCVQAGKPGLIRPDALF